MFPTFSGSSRRPRNVDLSGQRNTNPWANASWTPTQSGASKTVAQAQAERERRHREREELAATKRLQKVWRGHLDRRRLRDVRRQEYDALYRHPVSPQNLRQRIKQALPFLLAILAPTRSDDQQRLDWFISDILSLSSNLSLPIDFSLFSPIAWDRLARLLVRALEKRNETSSQTLLVITTIIVKQRPASVEPVLNSYYVALAQLANGKSHINLSQQDWVLSEAVVAPLAPNTDSGAPNLNVYQTFAFTFLTSRLDLLQRRPESMARFLDLRALSQSIIRSFSAPELPRGVTRDDLLWLLAHFVALNRAAPVSQDSRYLEALYMQMSFLAVDIRSRSTPPTETEDGYTSDSDEDTGEEDFVPLPDYVVSQLEFLVNEDGIADLLNRFATTASTTTHLPDDTSLLAGYTLVLLQCFPTHSDDIKMRLFQGDLQITEGGNSFTSPSVKIFWKAASKTNIFTTIVQQAKAKENLISFSELLKQDPIHDSEWRTVLLFLELYNFLLRVTDDEDFLPRATDIALQQSQATQRIRASGLGLDELKNLINFLKHLTFQLYYNLPDIMRPRPNSERLDAMMGMNPARLNTNHSKSARSSIAGVTGVDILGLRHVASSAMRALYERDSRRPFLPKDFWLMTAKFDMGVFISAVVLEELRNDEVSDEEENDNGGDPSTSSRNISGDWLSRATDHRRLRATHSEEFRGTIGPKLEVLRNMPFAIPFEVRVQIFRQFVHLDKSKRRGGHVDPDRWRLAILSGGDGSDGPTALGRSYLGRHTATISRGSVFDDAFKQFYTLGEGLKEPIQITFVDQFNQPEAGIDGGGVTKEFLISVTNDAFRPERTDGHTYFICNDQNLLYPNPSIFDDMVAKLRHRGTLDTSMDWKNDMGDIVRRYEFLGRIVGKCMYEGILIDISFASFFLLKWASSGQSTSTDYRANLNDLRDLDPELYQGLTSLKNYPGDVADLSLDFTIADSVWDSSGQRRTITRPLKKDGANIPVTNKDRPLYISYVANHRLVAQQYRQTKAFLRGLGTIINPSWLSMFNQSELQRLIGGDSSEIDVEDLRQNTSYSGLYVIGDDGEEHPTIRFFWDVMRKLKDSERRDVLKYVTSTPRAPLLGFSQLKPQFTIRDGGNDEERLPSTSTCVNLLKLPVYKSAAVLKAKLLYAVQSGAGFDLS
ncbi:putative HECT-domain-containing protein [Rosellinia necatrix]|uniref:HECT-type E3 ubiquitin transferase n=1 Tax=Rosellinia necatrix TaxID=77044 RepID=A0A1W2TS01_ROSNE|nr:putative HECT-domain-containing protein [Rosellinia necatrix]